MQLPHNYMLQAMKKPTYRTIWAYKLFVLGLLLGLVSCGSIPPKPRSPQTQTHTEITDKNIHHGVESQLLNTMAEARKLGPANPLLLSTMYSLASYYRDHQEFEKAEGMYQEAISLKEHVSGPHHQDVAIILNQYAALLRDAHRMQEATALEHRARKIQSSNTPHTVSRQ